MTIASASQVKVQQLHAGNTHMNVLRTLARQASGKEKCAMGNGFWHHR